MKASDLHNVLSQTVGVSTTLEKDFINFAALCTGIDSISKTISDVQSVLRGLTDAYAIQIEAETQLAVNMRNTMAARDEDIQSIKDLCSAQQGLGVIGDEVQLSGAQELATYLSEKQSLEQLIPVMNDMLAQQYGLNATQENAAQIASSSNIVGYIRSIGNHSRWFAPILIEVDGSPHIYVNNLSFASTDFQR